MPIRAIAYRYETGTHCITCAEARFAIAFDDPREKDENRIPFDAKGSEGNPVHAILNIEETTADLPKSAGGRSLICGSCFYMIKQHRKPRRKLDQC
jgi:hypothetical protein